MGIHAYAMGEGRMRREPQRGGREDASTLLESPTVYNIYTYSVVIVF
jgi:hypothetical protein